MPHRPGRSFCFYLSVSDQTRTAMWQNFRGYPSKDRFLLMAPDATVTPQLMMEFYGKHDYQACTKANIALLPFRESIFEWTRSHQRADADLMGPFLESTHGFSYVLVIVELFSRYVYVCPLAAKSDAFVALMNFLLLEEMNFSSRGGRHVKCFHFYDNREVMSGIFMPWWTEKYLKDSEMVAHFEK